MTYIKHYPVKNGDTSFVRLEESDKLTIQVDCKIKKKLEEDDFDVKKDLLDETKVFGKKYKTDLFVLSHPDKDHCQGFADNYYSGDPDDYSEMSYDNGEILIAELWVTSKLFSLDQSDDAGTIRNEANRRKRLAKDKPNEAQKEGNRLVIIGYDGEEKLEHLKHYHPGETVESINGKELINSTVFIHAPFKEELQSAEEGRNNTSIVFQLDIEETGYHSRAIFGGDADHYIWSKILNETKNHSNDAKLDWDLFLAPHHCSWTFFNDVSYEDNKEPKETSLEVLDDYGQKYGFVVASSKIIEDNEDNPPHYPANQEYEKHLPDKGTFLNTSKSYEDNGNQPIKFELASNGGFKRVDSKTTAKNYAGTAIAGTSKPVRHG